MCSAEPLSEKRKHKKIIIIKQRDLHMDYMRVSLIKQRILRIPIFGNNTTRFQTINTHIKVLGIPIFGTTICKNKKQKKKTERFTHDYMRSPLIIQKILVEGGFEQSSRPRRRRINKILWVCRTQIKLISMNRGLAKLKSEQSH